MMKKSAATSTRKLARPTILKVGHIAAIFSGGP